MSKLSKIAIVIQCITYNPSSLLFAKERKESLPNLGAKPYLRERSSESEQTFGGIPEPPDLLPCAEHRTLVTLEKAGGKGEEQLSFGLTKSRVLPSCARQGGVSDGHCTHGSPLSSPVLSCVPAPASRPRQVGHLRHSQEDFGLSWEAGAFLKGSDAPISQIPPFSHKHPKAEERGKSLYLIQ